MYLFFTLWTNLPHNKVLQILNDLTDFYFKEYTTKELTVNKYGFIWNLVPQTDL